MGANILYYLFLKEISLTAVQWKKWTEKHNVDYKHCLFRINILEIYSNWVVKAELSRKENAKVSGIVQTALVLPLTCCVTGKVLRLWTWLCPWGEAGMLWMLAVHLSSLLLWGFGSLSRQLPYSSLGLVTALNMQTKGWSSVLGLTFYKLPLENQSLPGMDQEVRAGRHSRVEGPGVQKCCRGAPQDNQTQEAIQLFFSFTKAAVAAGSYLPWT